MIEGSEWSLYQKGVRYLVGMEDEAAVVGLDAQGAAIVGPFQLAVPVGTQGCNTLRFRSLVPIPGTNDFFALFFGSVEDPGNQIIIQRASLADATVAQFPVIALSQVKYPTLLNIGTMLLRKVGRGWDLVVVSDDGGFNQGEESSPAQPVLIVTLDDTFQLQNFKVY